MRRGIMPSKFEGAHEFYFVIGYFVILISIIERVVSGGGREKMMLAHYMEEYLHLASRCV
jgi:hypothetical protein